MVKLAMVEREDFIIGVVVLAIAAGGVLSFLGCVYLCYRVWA